MIVGYEKFDFDSLEPVQAEDFQHSGIMLDMLAQMIDWAKTANVIIGGAWLCKWWYYGGYWHMVDLFNKWLWWLMVLIRHGQM